MNDEIQNTDLTQKDNDSTVATLEQQHSPDDNLDAVAPASLAQMLVEAGILAPEQVLKVQEIARRERQTLGRVLVRDGIIMSRDLATLTAVYLGLTMVDLKSEAIDPHAIALIPEDAARKHLVLGIKHSDNHLTVAMTDPTDLQLLQDLTARTGRTIEPVIAVAEDIQEQIDLSYRLTQPLKMEASLEEMTQPGERLTAKHLREALPTQVISMLLSQALQDRASDIHVEPSETRLRIRFRIDGLLHDVMELPMEMHPALISRLKIMSGMNIAERRRPQDGQLNFQAQNRTVDVRVAVANTATGEMAVLRLLDNKKFTLLTLDQLGIGGDALERYRKLLQLPYGMVIICGPTGAGKSTTLYASVLQMDRVEKKVISIEDPVEYRISDANQMQVNHEAGISFATALRSILRLDPDVILVGEIRDQETASIATQAALTGHLVLTSLHANDSVSGLLRLRDLGVPPYLIASSLGGIVAQRMVRMACHNCKGLAHRPLAEQQAYAAEMGETQERFMYGSGCNVCAQTGYHGRVGVFEIMTMSDQIRQLFLEDAPRHRLWEQAQKDGTRSIRHDGMLKVKNGVTTPYEVMRVLFTLE
jgi:type II secretory ATPase GspE/PulE/Tfp pilus assembly ATPase PilB-like protein